MRASITIQAISGKALVDAVVLGDFAIHQETDYREKGTGRPLYALTHIPTGLQVDGHYRSPLYLRSAMRYLVGCQWPKSVDEIRNSPRCRLDTIAAIELAERSSHWAHKRNFTKIKRKLTRQLVELV